MWPGRSFGEEVGRKKGYSILVGRISVSVKLARWRKAQKSTGSTTVQNGTQRGEIFRKVSGNGSKRRKRRRKNGNGKEEKSHTFSVTANVIEVTSE